MSGTITTRRHRDMATVYVDGQTVAIMEQRPGTKFWMYNPSSADNYSPRMYATGETALAKAAKKAAKHGLMIREREKLAA